ncbi:MAG: FKBP-type peptidyl-prolyl cis-trans isomerase [Opitutae bacterium]|nr:FKBP-type peptidyl-prolyl cis-trans isomerase [Opitutae bacterium]
MKFISKFSAGLASIGLLVAASADEPVKFNIPSVTAGQPAAAAGQKPAPTAAAPALLAPVAPAKPAAPKFTEAQLMEAYGWYTGLRMGLAELEFTKDQTEAMARGLLASAAGQPPPIDMQAAAPEIEAVLAKKNEVLMGKARARNLSEAAAFFTKLKENKNVQELPDGLRYEILKPGTGAFPKLGQTVKVHYVGSSVAGQVFDSSVARGQPVEFVLQAPDAAGGQGTIAGMLEGLQKINVGGKIRLYIPPHLAYGDDGLQGVIPPSAALVFEVEMLEVKDTPPAAPAPAAK